MAKPSTKGGNQRERRSRLKLSEPMVGVAIATSSTVGLVVNLAYARFAWSDLGIQSGDVGVGITEIAPPAFIIALIVFVGSLIAVFSAALNDPDSPVGSTLDRFVQRRVPWYVRWIKVSIDKVDEAIEHVAARIAVFTLGAALMLGALVAAAVGPYYVMRKILLSGHLAAGELFVLLLAGLSAGYVWHPIRMRGWNGLPMALLGVAFALGCTLTIPVVAKIDRARVEMGERSSIGLLPFGFGPTVRYITIVPHHESLDLLKNARCAVSFGNGPSGRIVRIVDAAGEVRNWMIDAQMASLRSAPPCDADARRLLWTGSGSLAFPKQ